ncbi:MAG: hypothetical protein ISS31_02475 [Kiritimatiellae bacterium]|nr:hypothetical protein [Kiritimatiellia bacterium]
MGTKDTYQYSRGPIGVPSVLLALAWVFIWLLWPSADAEQTALGRRRESQTEVSYGVVAESLYMSPLLFARATRVGFRAPEEATGDVELLDREDKSRRLRFLHVAPSAPDFNGMKRHASDAVPVKQVDAYRPVWKDSANFEASGSTNRIMVDVRGALRERGYKPGSITWPEDVSELQGAEIEAFVGVDAEGMAEGVFLERASGHATLDANVVRALERGTASAGTAPVSGRVTVTIRRMNESQD